jgi:hypothetical protein
MPRDLTEPTLSEASTSAREGRAVAALVGVAVGPVGVVMYETGNLDLFRAMPLLNIWLVVLLGLVGVCAGAAAIGRGMVLSGVVCLIANAAVLGLYGFLATFFSFGGSR